MLQARSIPELPKQKGVAYRHLPEWDGYCVGSNGDVLTCKKRGRHAVPYLQVWRKLNAVTREKGYLHVHLSRGRSDRAALVHHLVLEAFVGKRPPGMECRHLDGNPQNNRLENLKWGTAKENCRDSISHGTHAVLFGEDNKMSKLSSQQVVEIRQQRTVKSGVDLAKEYGVSRSLVSSIQNEKLWRHIK